MLKKIMSLFVSIMSESKKNSNIQPSHLDKVKEEDGYFVWKKGEDFSLSPYFKTREFSCQCKFLDCKDQKISVKLISKLDILRKEANQSLRITSGFRCTKHQASLKSGAVNTVVASVSTHEKGDAADVQPKDKNIAKFLLLAEKQFSSIGTAKTFLHLDTRLGYRRWVY